MTIRVQGIPSGNTSGASPRLRYFRRRKYMPPDIEWNNYDGILNCDVLYVQKRANMIGVIQEAKAKNIPVVYDTDDGNGVRRKGDDTPIFPLVDIITTDTEQRADAFRKITNTPVIVVPDGIDYIDKQQKPIEINKYIYNVCSFGSYRSIYATINILLLLPKSFKTFYITKRKMIKSKKLKYKKWAVNKLIGRLIKMDACLLWHEQTEEKEWKGNARLLVTMALGLPTIVGDTPSYIELMEACKMEDFIIRKYGEFPRKIELLKSELVRKNMQSKFLEYVWERYHPSIHANMLADIFRKVCAK